jgi:hypothetical protein
MQFSTHLSSLILPFFSASTTAFQLSLRIGSKCTGASNGTIVLGPGQGCLRDGAGIANSAVITSTGAIDDTFYTVFFSSTDCNPDTIIAKQGEACLEGKGYRSFAVWDMCKGDKKDCIP